MCGWTTCAVPERKFRGRTADGAPPAGSLVGQDGVELALGFVEDAQGLVALFWRAVEADLAQCVHDADCRVAEVLDLGHRVVAELGPRRVLRGRGGFRAACFGQGEAFAAAGCLRL